MDEFYVDLHCHSTMRAYHTTPKSGSKNIWDTTENDFIDSTLGRYAWKASNRVSKLSQSNFYNCINGKTRVVFDSLYPMERGFMHLRKVPKLLIGKKGGETIFSTSTGVSVEQFRKYKNNYDYFQDLQDQYNFLVANQGTSPCGKYNYKIASNYVDLEHSLKTNASAVNVVITIEGAHVFGCGTVLTDKIPLNEHKEILKNNIQIVKNWKYPPFFMTFAHHFWNQLCGHSTTFPIETKITCNQNKGLNKGFTELGEFVLEELLSTKNGKRILIDTRHMSVNARIHYINYVAKHNTKYPNDKIPLITSHSAVNGFEKFQDSIQKKDNKTKIKTTPFYAWSLNVSAEEAIAIHDSEGVAGIILDKGRHSGINLLKSIEKIQNKEEKKQQFLKLILDNIFFIIEAVNKKTAWNVPTLGTDFDGVITHFDFYEDMSTLPQLKSDLINYLKNNNYKSGLWFGYTPEDLIHKVFTQNAMGFLKKHFN